MSLTSLEFIMALLVLVGVFHSLPTAGARRDLLTLASFAYVATQLPNIASAITLILFCLSGYFVGAILAKNPRGIIAAIYHRADSALSGFCGTLAGCTAAAAK